MLGLLFIGGLCMTFAGVMLLKNDTNHSMKWTCIVFIATGISFILAAFFDSSVVFLILGLIGIIATCVVFVVEGRADAEKTEKKCAETLAGTMLDRFFIECVLAEVDDFSKPKNIQRAQLLAEKYALQYPDGVVTLYNQGLEAHKAITQKFISDRLEKKRAEEREEFEQLNKYSNLTGRNKRITMLNDQATKLKNTAKAQSEYANLLIRSSQQKERDWATWGGVASGLAGFGAGVSTAIDIQMENMRIREENEKRWQATLPAYMSMSDSSSTNTRNAEKIMEEIEGLKLKLVSEENVEELLNNISFSNTDVLVSETGSAMVCTSATFNPNYKIYNDVPAVVDGTLLAEIYDANHNLCGSALMVFPIYGLGKDIPLRGICLECCRPNVQYTVKFTAYHLWAMEK